MNSFKVVALATLLLVGSASIAQEGKREIDTSKFNQMKPKIISHTNKQITLSKERISVLNRFETCVSNINGTSRDEIRSKMKNCRSSKKSSMLNLKKKRDALKAETEAMRAKHKGSKK